MHNVKRVIFVLLFFLSLVAISMAATPEVSAVSPSIRAQSWVGNIIVTGANFTAASTVEFPSGEILIMATSLTSSTTLQVTIVVDQTATLGGHDLTVSNSDGTSVTLTNAITVVPLDLNMAFRNVYINGVKYRTPTEESSSSGIMTMTFPTLAFQVTPRTNVEVTGFHISAEVVAGSLAATSVFANATASGTFSADSANISVLVSQSGTGSVVSVPVGNITEVSNEQLDFYVDVSASLTAGETATIRLAGEDIGGNIATESLGVNVAEDAGTIYPVTSGGGGTASTPKNLVKAIPIPNEAGTSPINWDKDFFIQILPNAGYYIDASGFEIIILNRFGRQIYKKSFPGKVVDRKNISIATTDVARSLKSSGFHIVLTKALSTGDIIARNKMVFHK